MGDSVISVMRPLEGQPTRSALYIYVRDVDNVHRRAIEAGARSVQEPTRAIHGDRMATIIDPFGNLWTIAQGSNRSPLKSCIEYRGTLPRSEFTKPG